MAIKPRSRKHEDRLLKLECDLANMIQIMREDFAKRGGELRPTDNGYILYRVPYATAPTFWQRLNAYLSR